MSGEEIGVGRREQGEGGRGRGKGGVTKGVKLAAPGAIAWSNHFWRSLRCCDPLQIA
ncbi:MAG: hypothetical protein KME46_11090 [Brasilonema angustatum HA4187-MV1]|nr:hypothetical protein [Brasilonema angustatum HA4187-MV1]